MVVDLRPISPKSFRWGLGVAVFFAIVFTVMTDMKLYNIDSRLKFAYYDVYVHFFVMGGIAFVLTSLDRSKFELFGLNVSRLVVALLVLSFAEECSQMLRPNRGFSYHDMAANFAGITLFSFIASRLVKNGVIIR